MVTITQTVNLSLTQSLVPYIIHAKQYENNCRKILCRVYQDDMLVELDSNTIINVSGTRPDGNVFQYRSADDADVVFISDGYACFWVTNVMTSAPGRIAVDVTLTDGDVAAIGTFTIILCVEAAAVPDSTLATGSYTSLMQAVVDGIISIYVDDDGYLIVEADDVLEISATSDGEGGITVEY